MTASRKDANSVADELGDEIVDKFTAIRDSLSTFNFQLSTVDQPTGTVKVTLDDKGVPQYEICLGVAWDNIPLTNSMLEVAHQAQAACFGSLAQRSQTSRETIQAILDAMPEDALKVFDINLRQSWYTAEVIAESLQRANVLKINDEELDVVATMLLGEPTVPGKLIAEDADKTRRICRELIARYELDMLILTCGAIGSYVFTASKESYVATPKVQVADIRSPAPPRQIHPRGARESRSRLCLRLHPARRHASPPCGTQGIIFSPITIPCSCQ